MHKRHLGEQLQTHSKRSGRILIKRQAGTHPFHNPKDVVMVRCLKGEAPSFDCLTLGSSQHLNRNPVSV